LAEFAEKKSERRAKKGTGWGKRSIPDWGTGSTRSKNGNSKGTAKKPIKKSCRVARGGKGPGREGELRFRYFKGAWRIWKLIDPPWTQRFSC